MHFQIHHKKELKGEHQYLHVFGDTKGKKFHRAAEQMIV